MADTGAVVDPTHLAGDQITRVRSESASGEAGVGWSVWYWLYPRVIDEMIPAAFHRAQVHANKPPRDRITGA